MSNEVKYILRGVFYYLVSTMVSGAVLQTFLLELQLSTETVSVYVSVTQIVQMAVMLLFSQRIEQTEHVVHMTAFSMLLQTSMILAFLAFCFFQEITISAKTIIVYSVGILVNLMLGVHNVVIYKLPYHILNMKRYGIIEGISGLLQGIVGIVFSAVLTFFVSRHEYFGVMKGFLILGIVSAGICFWMIISCKDHRKAGRRTEKKKINLFSYKPFWSLLTPNLLRGIHSGVFNISIAIGYHLRLLDSTSASLILVIASISSIVGSLVYSVMAQKQIEEWLILFSGIVMVVVMPWMVAGSSTVFLVLYTIGYVAFHLVNNAVPVALTKVIDYQVIGQFSAWRMALFSAGNALAGVVCIPLIDVIGGVSVMLLAGCIQMISCILYFRYIRKTGRERRKVIDCGA